MLYKVLSEVIFLLINFFIAVGQANFFNKNMASGKTISHWVWALIYCVCAVVAYFLFKDFWFLGSLFLIRMAIFNQVLNYFRVPRKPFFYINSQKVGGSIVDRIEIFLYGNFYPYVWGIYVIALGLIQIKIKW